MKDEKPLQKTISMGTSEFADRNFHKILNNRNNGLHFFIKTTCFLMNQSDMQMHSLNAQWLQRVEMVAVSVCHLVLSPEGLYSDGHTGETNSITLISVERVIRK